MFSNQETKTSTKALNHKSYSILPGGGQSESHAGVSALEPADEVVRLAEQH